MNCSLGEPRAGVEAWDGALVTVHTLVRVAVKHVARLAVTPEAAQSVHTSPVLADALKRRYQVSIEIFLINLLNALYCFTNALSSHLHHLALINLGEVSSDGVHNLARTSPATELCVGGRGGGRTLLTLPAPPSSHRAAAHHPGLGLGHRGRAVVLAVLHVAELLSHVHTLRPVRGQHVVPGTLALVASLRVDTPPRPAEIGGEGTLVHVLTHHRLE